MSGRVEWIVGLVAGVAGVVGWILALLVALSINTPEGLGPRTIAFFVVMLGCIGGVTTGAYLHGRRGALGGLALLWVCTILVIVGTIISGFTVGIFFLPAAILALVASVAGSFSQPVAPAA